MIDDDDEELKFGPNRARRRASGSDRQNSQSLRYYCKWLKY